MSTETLPTRSSVEAAAAYLEDGFAVIPVPKGKKSPKIKGWQTLKLSKHDVAKYFGKSDNVGVLLGKKASWLVDVDLDADEAVAAADAFLPKTKWIHGRGRKPGSHWFYRAKGAKTRRFKDPLGDCLVELRSTGHQTLVPPSIHPSGDRYDWNKEGSPSRVSTSELTHAVARLAACALVARTWPKKGDRHNCALALAGMLLRAGWSTKEAEHFLGTAAKIAGDQEQKKRIAVVHDTKKKLKKSKPVTGRLTLTKIFGEEVVKLIIDWLEITPHPAKPTDGAPSGRRDVNLTAIRLLEIDQPQQRHVVEVKAEAAGKTRTFGVSPAVLKTPKRLAGVVADRTGEMLNDDDPLLFGLRDQIPSIPRVHAVSRLGWTPQRDAFMYGKKALRTARQHEKLIFRPEEVR